MEFFIKDQPAPSIQEADGQFVVTLPLVAG